MEKKEEIAIHRCEICNKSFSRKDILTRHKKTIHEINQIYHCKSCDFSTTRKDSLNRHMIEVHEKIRTHICDLCGKKFSQAKSLRRHTNSIHTQKEKYACTHCDSAFFREDNLLRHIQSVHLELRPNICNECGAAFKLPQHLKEHIVSLHSDERSYICEECGFAFKLPQHLNDHLKVVHQNHRPHICEECGASFSHSRQLKLHIIAIHTDEKPYVCETCNRGFADPSHLYGHKKAEACWFTNTTAYKWEELCKEIAEVLLEGLDWEWKPKINTPEIAEQSWIQPEIVVYYENNTKRIIDAKRSTQAIFKEKDLKVYPRVAEKVEFWCLYGKLEGMFEEVEEMEAKSSVMIIRDLKKKKDEGNKDFVDALIMKIEILKKGLDYKGQQILTDSLE